MYVPFQKWNCFGIVLFQANMQFNSHSFDSISCQFVIPLQFTLKVENSRIIPILKFQFQCPGLYNAFASCSGLESVSLKAAFVLPQLVLQRPRRKSSDAENRILLEKRLKQWEEGDLKTKVGRFKVI